MIRAILFDIYNTVLALRRPAAPAEAAWVALAQTVFSEPPLLTRQEFRAACARSVSRRHAADLARGIAHPEVCWPDVVREVLPQMDRLAREDRDWFVLREMQLERETCLNPGAAEVLRYAHGQGTHLGIVSNAQAYTLTELDVALRTGGLTPNIFDPQLVFWSFRHGFSKPNPHVLRIVSAGLQELGIAPAETLMIGDRLDNDIEPARAFGWKTWWLTSRPQNEWGGAWDELLRFLREPSDAKFGSDQPSGLARDSLRS